MLALTGETCNRNDTFVPTTTVEVKNKPPEVLTLIAE
jgi:hypothetical protein